MYKKSFVNGPLHSGIIQLVILHFKNILTYGNLIFVCATVKKPKYPYTLHKKEKNTHVILILLREMKPKHEDQLSFAGICISTVYNIHITQLLRYTCSGVTIAPATPAMQGGGTLGGRHITKLTVF